MKKKYILATGLLVLALLCPASAGYSAEQTPEGFVQEFYRWYLKVLDTDPRPERQDTILKYVDPQKVEWLRRYGNDGRDYFTQLGIDLAPDVRLNVRPGTAINEELYIVPVDFEAIKTYHIVVIVRKKSGELSIVRTVDAYPHL